MWLSGVLPLSLARYLVPFHRARIVEGRWFRFLSSFCIESSWYSFISPNFKEHWRAQLANTATTSHVWLFKSIKMT